METNKHALQALHACWKGNKWAYGKKSKYFLPLREVKDKQKCIIFKGQRKNVGG